MDSQEVTNFREKVNQSLCNIINLKDKLERLEKSQSSTIQVSLDFDKVRIDNTRLISKPIREFLKHQLIIQLKVDIKKEEEFLSTLKYNISNE